MGRKIHNRCCLMTNIEFDSYIVEFIKYFGGTEPALKAVQNTRPPPSTASLLIFLADL